MCPNQFCVSFRERSERGTYFYTYHLMKEDNLLEKVGDGDGGWRRWHGEGEDSGGDSGTVGHWGHWGQW